MIGTRLWNKGELWRSHPQGSHFLSLNSLTEMVRGFHKASQGEFYLSWEPCLPGILKVGPDKHMALRVAISPVERPWCPCPQFVSQQCQDLDSLGSIDPFKGKCPCPLEAPPSMGLAFMLHLVGEEPCQGKVYIWVIISILLNLPSHIKC